jgi:hypothetical protein
MAKITAEGKALLEAQAVLFILLRFHGTPKERAILVQRAKEELTRYGRWVHLDLEEVKMDDFNLYVHNAVETLVQSGSNPDKARELTREYRGKVAEKLGVLLYKEGARLDSSNRRGVADAM